jgi:two-component system, NtrC family, sensor histidine kinase HydH
MSNTILVVDNDLPILELLIEALGDEGYEVRGCSTQHQAQVVFQSATPDLLLLDVRFPDLENSVGFIEQLRGQPATYRLAVIVCSADWFYLEQQASRLNALGCAVVSKPFALEDLLTLIKHNLIAAHDRERLALKAYDRG